MHSGVFFSPVPLKRFYTYNGESAQVILLFSQYFLPKQFPPADDYSIFQCNEGAVYLQKQNANGEWLDDQELSTDNQYANVFDLTPCSDYRYRIKVVNTHESSVTDTIDVATNVDSKCFLNPLP